MDHTQSVHRPKTSQPGSSSARRVYRFLLVPVSFIAVLYLAAVGYMYLNQRALLFKPAGNLPDPAAVGLSEAEVISLPMSDGTSLTAWSVPAVNNDAPTVLFFHGQGGNLGDRSERMREIVDSGYGLLAPSYRGYPGSDGQPSETAFVSDGLELFDWLTGRSGAIILHGQSLGTGVAAAVAAQRPTADLLVLEAPFTATVDVAGERYPWLPVNLLMQDQFATRDIIDGIQVPTLIFHGTNDEIVPLHHSETLAALAEDTAQLFTIADGTHDDLWSHGLWRRVQTSLPPR